MSRILLLLSLVSTCSALLCHTCHQVEQSGYTSKHMLGIKHLIVRTVKESGYPQCGERSTLRACSSTCRIMEWKRSTGTRHLAVKLYMCADEEAAEIFTRISPYKQIMQCRLDGCNSPKIFWFQETYRLRFKRNSLRSLRVLKTRKLIVFPFTRNMVKCIHSYKIAILPEDQSRLDKAPQV